MPSQLGPMWKYQSLVNKQTEEAGEAFNQPNKHVAMIELLTLVIRARIFKKLVLSTKSLSQKNELDWDNYLSESWWIVKNQHSQKDLHANMVNWCYRALKC